MLRPRVIARRWREFWASVPSRAYGSFVSESHDGVVRLHALCPTVDTEAAKKLEKKRQARLDQHSTKMPIG